MDEKCETTDDERGITSSRQPATAGRPPAADHRQLASGNRPPATGNQPPTTDDEPPVPSPQSLSPEEKRFIVQTLQQLELRGNAEALRRAVELIDSVVEKLGGTET